MLLLPTIATGLLMLAPDQAATPVAMPVAPAVPAAAQERAADPNARICKRSAPTGSIIASRKECRTAAEWTRLAEAGGNHASDIVERGRMGGMNNN